MGHEQIKINVDCQKFSGDESDKLEFKNWYDQIDAVVKGRPNWSESYKIMFLKSKVVKNAATFIAHIDPGPGSYEECIKVLKEQYLNKPYIIDEYFKILLVDKPEFDETYYKSRTYIANTRNHFHNLKTHYEIDLMDETYVAHKLLAHIIFAKFSAELRQALNGKLGRNTILFSKF